MRRLLWLIPFALAGAVGADDMPDPVRPVLPGPALPAVELPAVPAPLPPPVVPPAPGGRVSLTAGRVFDPRTRGECVVRAYPTGLVAVTKRVVPAGQTLVVAAAFTDGQPEHTYAGPITVWQVRATGTGAVDLVVTPLGLKSEKEIVTVGIDADSGQGPIPPPKPKPPEPPAPKPVEPAAPIPAVGLHVMVVYDPMKLSAMTVTQQGALYAKDVRDYLRDTCPKGPDGVTAEWRMWPADVDATGESKLWQDAFKRPRAALPWVIVSNGATGFEGPLPGSAADMLALLKKYGSK